MSRWNSILPGSVASPGGRAHWDDVYGRKAPDSVSWYRPHLDTSLALLDGAGLHAGSRVIDIGGGASTLVDDLLARGVRGITVLDLSRQALDVARERLGEAGAHVRWWAADLLEAALPAAGYDLWHDRAVLHFLVDPAAAAAYAAQAARAIAPGGHAIIGGFAPDGPERCSGLPVARRAATDLAALMGEAFILVREHREMHRTPGGQAQSFEWGVLRRC
jgi:SAM-dependent methyltransferase